MICTKFDSYMENFCHRKLMISWKISLNDGTIVYGDYDKSEQKNPWNRLKHHCKKNDLFITKVELYMFGAPHEVFFENESGLDGIFIVRGVAKDQAIDGSFSRSFQTLTVGLLNDDCSEINVRKFCWPMNEFEKSHSVRGLSEENLKKMIFKNGSKKEQHPEVQKYLDGAVV
jgi:hypothetical protein